MTNAAQPDQRMLDALQNQLLTPNGYAPPQNNNYLGYFWGMSSDANWFAFVPIFLRLQSLIRENNLRNREELRNNVPRPQNSNANTSK